VLYVPKQVGFRVHRVQGFGGLGVWVVQGNFMPGMLFIDEVHMLETECFMYLNW
jgi:hypothetical protein